MGFFYTFRRASQAEWIYSLAEWQAGSNTNTRWISDLRHIDGVTVTGDGFPLIYRVQAKHVLPHLMASPRLENLIITEPLENWDPEEWLQIDGWDQS